MRWHDQAGVNVDPHGLDTICTGLALDMPIDRKHIACSVFNSALWLSIHIWRWTMRRVWWWTRCSREAMDASVDGNGGADGAECSDETGKAPGGHRAATDETRAGRRPCRHRTAAGEICSGRRPRRPLSVVLRSLPHHLLPPRRPEALVRRPRSCRRPCTLPLIAPTGCLTPSALLALHHLRSYLLVLQGPRLEPPRALSRSLL